jgi:hypothetical protein
VKNILIIAAREFRHIASMRSFWLTLLILPVAFALGPIAQRFLRDDSADRVIIVDRTGGSAARSLESASLRTTIASCCRSCRATSGGTSLRRRILRRSGRSTTAGTATPTWPSSKRRAGWR